MEKLRHLVNRISSRRSLRLALLIAGVMLVALTAGLASWAGISINTNKESHSGDLAYLEVQADGSQAVDYVLFDQPGTTCNAEAFEDGGTVLVAGRIEAEVIEDGSVTGLCVRADYGYGNYLYAKYGDEEAFVSLEEVWLDTHIEGLESLNLRVGIGGNAPGEYTALIHRGATCDASAFADASKVKAVFGGQFVKLHEPETATGGPKGD